MQPYDITTMGAFLNRPRFGYKCIIRQNFIESPCGYNHGYNLYDAQPFSYGDDHLYWKATSSVLLFSLSLVFLIKTIKQVCELNEICFRNRLKRFQCRWITVDEARGKFCLPHNFITLRPRQNGHHFPDDICKHILLNESVEIQFKSH